eukprot:3005212-Rhodomonas_salina.1
MFGDGVVVGAGATGSAQSSSEICVGACITVRVAAYTPKSNTRNRIPGTKYTALAWAGPECCSLRRTASAPSRRTCTYHRTATSQTVIPWKATGQTAMPWKATGQTVMPWNRTRAARHYPPHVQERGWEGGLTGSHSPQPVAPERQAKSEPDIADSESGN